MRTGTAVDLTKSPVGTTCYLPPEALRGISSDGNEDDDADGDDGDGGGGGGGGNGAAPGRATKAPMIQHASDGGAVDGGSGGGEAGEESHLLAATPALDMWSAGCILYM